MSDMMPRVPLFVITIFTIVIILSSCSTVPAPYIIAQDRQKQNIYYIPPSANAPLLKNRGDLSINLNGTIGRSYSMTEAFAAFMPAAHFGMYTNFSFSSDNGINKFGKQEVALGYILAISPTFHFEIYGGFGRAGIKNIHATGESKVTNYNWFIQPAISFYSSENIELGIVSRFSNVHFKVKDTSFDFLREPYSSAQLKTLSESPRHIFWEPGLTLRFGWKQILFNVNAASSAILSSKNFGRAKNSYSIGVSLRFNTGNKNWVPG